MERVKSALMQLGRWDFVHTSTNDYVYCRGYGRDRYTLTTQQRTAVAARILLCTLYSGWFYEKKKYLSPTNAARSF